MKESRKINIVLILLSIVVIITHIVFNILNVMTLITINLGIFNMLPFPALDGGRFLLLLIEWIFRKPIPRKVEKYINAAGFIILMGFMVVVTCKDIWQLFTGQLSL